MRILQLGLTYAPQWARGGLGRFMFDLGRQLAGRGDEVWVYTADSSMATPKDGWPGFPAGMTVRYFRQRGGWRRRFYFDYSWSELQAFFRAHHDDVDVIHLYQTRCLVNIAALWASYRYDIPLALSSFGSLPSRGGAGKMVYDSMFVRPLIRRSRLLLGQTRHECDTYVDYGARPDRVHLLPLGVDFRTCPEDATGRLAASFRARYDIPLRDPLVLFLGRMHPTKGVDFLIGSFARVKELLPTACLAIVGTDEGAGAAVMSAIRRTGLDRAVRVCGPLYDADRWQAYHAADCFAITPAVYEETALASIEAMACGTPVVATERADVPWLEDYEAGHVVAADDADAVASALVEILSASPERRRQVRQNARRLAAERFEIAAVAQHLRSLLQPVVEGRRVVVPAVSVIEAPADGSR